MIIRRRFGKQPTPVAHKLLRAIEKTDRGCWEYCGVRGPKGYGVIKLNGKLCGAHRLSFLIHKGPIPDGLLVMHTCDNPSCVNPEHLRLGNERDNRYDMYAKGRQQKGEKVCTARLTASDVAQIRQSPKRNFELANDYGVGRTAIHNIRTFKSWKHVS